MNFKQKNRQYQMKFRKERVECLRYKKKRLKMNDFS